MLIVRADSAYYSRDVLAAEMAQVPFTAFASRGAKHAITARLVVRRVGDQNPDHVRVNA